MKVCIPTTYTFRPAGAEALAGEQQSVTVAEAREEVPADLDSALAALEDCLRKLDELIERDRNFPSELAGIEAKHKTLTDLELDSVEAIQSRSADMSKISAMRELAGIRQKKVKAAIAVQQEAVIKIGARAAGLLEQRWWANYTRLADEAKSEFHRLFYHVFEQDLLTSYKPLVLLGWLKTPDFRTGALDVKLTRCRQLRVSTDRLREFEKMSFSEIADELELQDSEARERAQQVREIGSEPVS